MGERCWPNAAGSRSIIEVGGVGIGGVAGLSRVLGNKTP